MQARMRNIVTIVPDAMKALLALNACREHNFWLFCLPARSMAAVKDLKRE